MNIYRAKEDDCDSIIRIGKLSVAESHKGSSSEEDMNEYLEQHYNADVIIRELTDPDNQYHIITNNNDPAGFSKMVLNAKHPDLASENIAKLDRIYLLKEYYGLSLGLQLLHFNLELAKSKSQNGIWLYAWIGNERAIRFYLKAGFTIIGEHKFYINETHYDVSHHMFLQL